MYKVGDIVRVKPYQELVDEFGEGADKKGIYANTPMKFTEGMKKYCGREAIVIRVVDNDLLTLSFDGYPSHYCFEGYSVYKDDSNYHQIRCLNENQLANLLNEVARSGHVGLFDWLSWLKTSDPIDKIK